MDIIRESLIDVMIETFPGMDDQPRYDQWSTMVACIMDAWEDATGEDAREELARPVSIETGKMAVRNKIGRMARELNHPTDTH